jgi:hypothetical protein
MATNGRTARPREDRVVRLVTDDQDYEIEVTPALNKWCVTVYRMPERELVTQDFFPERWKAIARSQDFLRLLNHRKKSKTT